ncbi:Down syndrome cell adhesion molecule -like protein [Collichthys lucidus]|uniref:Down syndrome cell adhesion molecule-like protein n=1 Tax=Collichthys lucidus TaxID=240159 RepID=A0A4U5UEH6_COLLU|nr:Down syndrome cell adhesion molecule -like protein [Collichthys lucidus]
MICLSLTDAVVSLKPYSHRGRKRSGMAVPRSPELITASLINQTFHTSALRRGRCALGPMAHISPKLPHNAATSRWVGMEAQSHNPPLLMPAFNHNLPQKYTAQTSSSVSFSTVKVVGFFGDNVTLPCSYDTRIHGTLDFCWGRGKLPRSKCSNTILSEQGGMLSRQSSRYQLLGEVKKGNVSLTILNVQWDDAGKYSCRIEIPGWFNDQKVNIDLVIEEGPPDPLVIETREHYGRLSVCWGRGAIPNSGCNNEVIKSDGTSVTSRLSERYLLMGNLGGGDVSLTIRQVEKTDSGVYGCRVEIPGWFNDHKHQVTLTVEAAPPDPLSLEIKAVKEKSITFGWTSGFDGGEPILSYNLDLQDNKGTWQSTTIEHGELPQLTLMDLSPATTYKLRMFAINSVGKSEVSNLLIVKTREAAPDGPPLDLQLESLTSHSIRVTWKPPNPKLRNGILLSYSISYREYDHASKQYKRWQHVSVSASKEIERVVLDNLKPSTSYGVIVQAKTSAGTGPAATVPLCTTLDIVAPDPPVVELKEVQSHLISISWTPGFDGGSPITGYYLEYKEINNSWDHTDNIRIDFKPDETDATLLEINHSTYNIRMFAKNSHGTSKASNVLTVTIEETGTSTQEMETLNGTTHTPKAELCRRGWSPGLVAPERMHGPRPKKLPDVGPSGAYCGFVIGKADAKASSSKERRRIGGPPSSWQLNTVEVLDLFRGLDQLSSAVEDKWLALLNGRRVWKDGGRGGKPSSALSVPPAHGVASLAVYVRVEGRLALRLSVRSGCVYICLALEPGAWNLEPGAVCRCILDISQKTVAGSGD